MPERPEYRPDADESAESRPEQKDRMVDATRISTVFSRPDVLEQIADGLLSEGKISGFSVEPVSSGYLYQGQKTKERQYVLNILCAAEGQDGLRQELQERISRVIGAEWDAPAIREEQVQINERFLTFIQRAGIEHQRFVRERRIRHALSVAALLSVGSMVGLVGKTYVAHREREAVTAEQQKSYDRLRMLEDQIREQVFALEGQIQTGEPLEERPTDMAAASSFQETQQINETIRKAEEEMRLFLESGSGE